MSLAGSTVAIASPFHDSFQNGGDSGAVYMFDMDCLVLGELNCDGAIDALDIKPFILALFDPDEYAIQFPECDINGGDINGDGSIDAFDIEPFLDLLFP